MARLHAGLRHWKVAFGNPQGVEGETDRARVPPPPSPSNSYCTIFTAGGFQVPSRIDGDFIFGQ